MSARKLLSLVLLCLVACLSPLCGRAVQTPTVTFTFNPTVGTIIDETSKVELSANIMNTPILMTLVSSGFMEITRQERGEISFSTTVERVDVPVNTLDSPEMAAEFTGGMSMYQTNRLYFTPAGRLLRAESDEQQRKLFLEELGAVDVPEPESVRRERVRAAVEEWQSDYGRLIGRTVKVGDLWIDRAVETLPGLGSSQRSLYRSTRFVGWDRKQDTDVMIVNVIVHHSAEGLARAINRPVNDVKAAVKMMPNPVPAGYSVFSVETLVIDPATMRILSTKTEGRLTIQIPGPNGKKVTMYLHVKEEEQYTPRGGGA